MAHTNELKPCPFCGWNEVRDSVYIRDGREIQCGKCGAAVHAYNPDANEKAGSLWNRRVLPPAYAPMVAALEEAAEHLYTTQDIARVREQARAALALARKDAE